MQSKINTFFLNVMLAPYILGMLALVIIPAVITFSLALYRYDLISPPQYIGFANFTELLQDKVFRISLANSLQFIAIGVPLRLLAAIGVALLLYKTSRSVAFHRTTAFLPTVIPDIAYALLWAWIFNPLYGPLNLFLQILGLPVIPWFIDATATQTAVILMSVFQFGEGFLVAMIARSQIPSEYYEALALEGAGAVKSFLFITLPVMFPVFLLLFLRDIIFSFQVTFVPALIMTNGGPPPYSTTYLPLFIYDTAFSYLRFGYAAAATVLLFILTALIVLLQYYIIKKLRRKFLI